MLRQGVNFIPQLMKLLLFIETNKKKWIFSLMEKRNRDFAYDVKYFILKMLLLLTIFRYFIFIFMVILDI